MSSFKKTAVAGLLILLILVNGCATIVSAPMGIVAGAITCPVKSANEGGIGVVATPFMVGIGAIIGLIKGIGIGLEADGKRRYDYNLVREITDPCM